MFIADISWSFDRNSFGLTVCQLTYLRKFRYWKNLFTPSKLKLSLLSELSSIPLYICIDSHLLDSKLFALFPNYSKDVEYGAVNR